MTAPVTHEQALARVGGMFTTEELLLLAEQPSTSLHTARRAEERAAVISLRAELAQACEHRDTAIRQWDEWKASSLRKDAELAELRAEVAALNEYARQAQTIVREAVASLGTVAAYRP